MLLTKPLNFVSKFLIFFSFSFFLFANVIANEPVDVWKKKEKEKEEINIKSTPDEKSQIDYSKKQKNLAEIKIDDKENNTE